MSKIFDGDEPQFTPIKSAGVETVRKEYVDVPAVEESEAFKNDLLKQIREISVKEVDLSRKVYFKTSGACKAVYNVDSGNLTPSVVCCVGGGFERKYQLQLKNILSGEGLDEGKMMELITLYRGISLGEYPMLLKSKKYSRLLPVICKTLNDYFYEYRGVLRSMYTMFNSNVTTKMEEVRDVKLKTQCNLP